MNISPINGYEIKHREAKKLSEDIEKFLNGRKVKIIESTFKPKKTREECKPFKPEVNWRYKPNKKKVKSEVIIEQSTLLAKYLSVTPFYKRWANLLEKADHVVSLGEIKKVASGDYAIADKRTWAKVKDAVESIISDIEAGRLI